MKKYTHRFFLSFSVLVNTISCYKYTIKCRQETNEASFVPRGLAGLPVLTLSQS